MRIKKTRAPPLTNSVRWPSARRRLLLVPVASLALACLALSPTAREDDDRGPLASGAGKVTIYPGISRPSGITAGPDGALWFTNNTNNSIGRITTAGKVTNYPGTGISGPFAITAGPDGALWFTNDGIPSIGRITTAGVVTNYTATGIGFPFAIAAGLDRALWFTNSGNNSIGRITTTVTP